MKKYLLSLIIIILISGVSLSSLASSGYKETTDLTYSTGITILNINSHPKAGDNWEVSFETEGEADLTITPIDQQTIDELDFISLKCLPSEALAKEGDGEERTSQILENNAIFYPNWFCEGQGKITHLVKVTGEHTLKFQFGDQIAYAYNSPGEGDYLSSWDTSGSGNTSPLGITTNGNYFWIVDVVNGEVYKYDMDGTYTNTHWDTSGSGNAAPIGITTNGNYFWITDYPDGKVYKYDMDGTYISSWDTAGSGNAAPVGITTDGNYFWIADYVDDEVYKYDMDGTYISSWDTAGSGNAAPVGITTDGNYFWITDDIDDEVYKYDMDGTYTNTHWDTAGSGNSMPLGITTDGNYFWITNDIDDEVYKYEGPAPCTDHNVQGWAWSENIGWISFSCESGGGTVDYGVDINTTTAKFSGYAWAGGGEDAYGNPKPTIGWISFNSGAVVNCPNPPCPPVIDLDTGDVSGWARACTVFTDACDCGEVCSNLKPDSERGGWDGWIHLRDANYGVYATTVDSYSEFYNWAWGGDDSSSTAVIGWISFNCENTSCPNDYKVTTTLTFLGANNPPIADFDCDPSACNSSDCIGYNDCPLVMINNSTDTDPGDTLTSTWYIDDEQKGTPCPDPPSSCNFTPVAWSLPNPPPVSSTTYDIKLIVEDSAGATSSDEDVYYHRRSAIAGFRCSLDNSDWSTACGDFPPVEAGTVMYFKDNLLGDYPDDSSYPSCCGNTINSRTWKRDEVPFGGNNSLASTTLSSFPSDIKLEVVDSPAGRWAEEIHTIGGKPPVPLWIEVSP